MNEKDIKNLVYTSEPIKREAEKKSVYGESPLKKLLPLLRVIDRMILDRGK
jgi:hypothetical protein